MSTAWTRDRRGASASESFVERARALAALLRAGTAKRTRAGHVRVQDGGATLVVTTEESHNDSNTIVTVHGHAPGWPLLTIEVHGSDRPPNAFDLGTDTAVGSADLLDLAVSSIDDRSRHMAGRGLLQSVADVCGALLGPMPWPVVLHGPTPWNPIRLVRADGVPVEVPTEAVQLVGSVPEVVNGASWMRDAHGDVPEHPCAWIEGWSVAAQPVDAMTVARALTARPRSMGDTGKDD